MVQEAIEQLIEMNLDNPFDEYNGEDWGWHGFDRCYLKIECSRDWVGLVTKDSSNLIGDNSLDGLDIDWHLAEYDYSPMVPVSNDQPSYAYAA